MNKIKEWFKSLEPNKKKNYVKIGVGAVFILIMMLAYNAKKSNEEPQKVSNIAVKEKKVDFTGKDDDLALRIGLKNQLAESEIRKNEEFEKQRKEIEELKKMIEGMSSQGAITDNGSGRGIYGDLTLKGVPPPPTGYGGYENVPTEEKLAPPIIINGNIGNVSIAIKKLSASEEDNATRKISRKILKNFIPAGSFLKATLLNGMYAPTMGKASSSPYPALLRLWDLGFLPNDVRKDLSGCFVLGQAYGELSDSRVHIRLDKLSCISNDSKKVLEKKINGFVNGDDGKVGIFGEIRANFGKVALAALLAEFVSAAGDAVKSATQVVTQNPLGGLTTYTPKTEDILISAAGSGFGEAASMIAEFYLDIMKEMSPVIEVSGRRDVEIIVSEGIELITDDFEWLGVKENEKANIIDIINNG